MLKRVVSAIVFGSILVGAAYASVPLYAHLSVYKNYGEDFIESIEDFKVQALAEEPILYTGTECAALGPNGEVAIFSGPARNEGYEKVISVYDGNGTFQYAYELYIEHEPRAYSIFFVEDSHSLFLFRYYTVYEFSPEGDGIVSSYTIGDRYGILGDYWPVRGFDVAYIAPQSEYHLLEYTRGRLSIINPQGETITIYDHSREYIRWLFIQCLPLFYMAVLLVFFGIVYHRVRKRERMKKD